MAPSSVQFQLFGNAIKTSEIPEKQQIQRYNCCASLKANNFTIPSIEIRSEQLNFSEYIAWPLNYTEIPSIEEIKGLLMKSPKVNDFIKNTCGLNSPAVFIRRLLLAAGHPLPSVLVDISPLTVEQFKCQRQSRMAYNRYRANLIRVQMHSRIQKKKMINMMMNLNIH